MTYNYTLEVALGRTYPMTHRAKSQPMYRSDFAEKAASPYLNRGNVQHLLNVLVQSHTLNVLLDGATTSSAAIKAFHPPGLWSSPFTPHCGSFRL